MNPFVYKPPAWANTPAPHDAKGALERAYELSRSYYALGAQTGIHSMIEWCGVMGEHVKLLRYAYEEHGVEPDAVDQHSDTKVDAPDYMVAYLCEKLGCQLKPFIRGNKAVWQREINKWFA